MPYQNLLFTGVDEISNLEKVAVPDFFVDLNLDQVVDAITARKQEYNLKPFFFSPLQEVDDIYFRQEIFKDLENEKLLESIKSFAEKMILVRRYLNLVNKLYYKYHQEGWFLDAAVIYCDAVQCLSRDFEQIRMTSRGLLGFKDFLSNYVCSTPFTTLVSETTELKARQSSIQYCVIIKDNQVRVRNYEAEIDYSKEVERTFERFKQGEVKNYRVDLVVGSGMDHVEAQILECVAKLFPDLFSELDTYYLKHKRFVAETILSFDRQIQFYVSYLDFIANIKLKGLEFCYPRVSAQDKTVHTTAAFDIALANSRLLGSSPVVCNDFQLKDKERIIVVSGPNQGGKTTFARMFGQVHFLANLGCLVPGKKAKLFLFDRLLTHFEKEEDIRNLRGKLQDELVRIHAILNQATTNSIIIMNEIFTSTTLKDAVLLSKEIMERIIQKDILCVCVSFLDELSRLGEQTVSMVSTIFPENPTLRTFKIIRKPADGLSYAICIAEKHRLTYDLIMERIEP